MAGILIHQDNKKLKEQIKAAIPIEGYCVFIDMVNSTGIKASPWKEWIPLYFNTFSQIMFNLAKYGEPIKIIGDALMYFIDKDVDTGCLYKRLLEIIYHDATPSVEVKVGACYCKEILEITFKKGQYDVYGRDIDLTNRLLNLAEKKEKIIMNDEFYKRLPKDKIMHKSIYGPFSFRIKGFDEYKFVYKHKEV